MTIRFSILLLLLILSCGCCLAEDSDPEVEQAKRQNELLTLQKERLELELAIAKARTGNSELSGAEGKISSTGGALLEKVQAYRALVEVSDTIAERVSALPRKHEKHVILMTSKEAPLAEIYIYQTAIARLESLYQSFSEAETEGEKLLKDPSPSTFALGPAIASAKGILGGLGEIVAFFKNDIEIKGADFDIAESAVAAEVWGALTRRVQKRANLTVFLPEISPSPVTPPDKTEIDRKISQMVPVLESVKEINKKLGAGPQSQEVVNFLSESKPLVSGYEEWLTILSRPNKDTGITPLQKMKQASVIGDALNADDVDAHILYLDPVAGGGANRTVRGVFNFGSISYAGGTVVVFMALNLDGSIADAGTIYATQGYQRIKDSSGYIPRSTRAGEVK